LCSLVGVGHRCDHGCILPHCAPCCQPLSACDVFM
jgi:hypothetical protein